MTVASHVQLAATFHWGESLPRVGSGSDAFLFPTVIRAVSENVSRRLNLLRLAPFLLSPREWMARRGYTKIFPILASALNPYRAVTVGAGIRTSAATVGKPKRQTQNSQAFHCFFFLRSGESPQCPA